MSRTGLSWLGLSAASVLCACGTATPIRFYTLSSIAPPAAVAAAASASRAPVRIEPVTIPAQLDRLQLVTHEGPNRVRISDSDRWAAPLDEQIRRTLSDDLAARLPANQVAAPNEPRTDEARRQLSIDVSQFDADEHCAVTLLVNWTLSTSIKQSTSGSERIDMDAATPCPGSLPAAMSQALARLADRLASMLQSS